MHLHTGHRTSRLASNSLAKLAPNIGFNTQRAAFLALLGSLLFMRCAFPCLDDLLRKQVVEKQPQHALLVFFGRKLASVFGASRWPWWGHPWVARWRSWWATRKARARLVSCLVEAPQKQAAFLVFGRRGDHRGMDDLILTKGTEAISLFSCTGPL